tara:strand:+ start:3169 stop:3396 length:228 start_codon:yes stop_codon:yes gene_type:complete
MTYKEILDAQWAIDKSIIHAQSKYDEYYNEYGKHDKKDLLTEMAYGDLKLLREAKKTLVKMVNLMRANDLYTNSV